MKKILITVQLETQFNELLRVAHVLRNTQLFEVVFCFYSLNSLRFKRFKSYCDQEQFKYVLFDQNESDFQQEEQISANEIQGDVSVAASTSKFKSWIKENLPGLYRIRQSIRELSIFIKLFKINFHELHKKLEFAKEFIKIQKPDTIIVAEDGVGGPLVLIKAAQLSHIPTVIIPYEYSTSTQPAESLMETNGYKTLFGMDNLSNRIIYKIFPNWGIRYKNELILRDLSHVILAEELLRIAPSLPWFVHGGGADFLIVENKAMYQHYLDQGIRPEKMQLLGAIYDDVLARHMELAQQQKHTKDEVFKILVALPPDHTAYREKCDFNDYHEVIDFWLENILALENTQVTFQVHPRVTPEQEAYIHKKGIKVLRQDIATLLPYCDLFVTSVSSIIRQAIAASKVVLNYDVYRFGYKDYDRLGGVITVQEKMDFVSDLEKLVYDKTYFADQCKSISITSKDWGITDGLVSSRITHFFTHL